MKRNLIGFLVLMLLMVQQGYSQVFTAKEDFDGNTVSYTQRPSGSWVFNTTYYLPSLSGANISKSYLGLVPSQVGDTIFLELSTPCDFQYYSNVYLRFNHICKVSPNDITQIQYRRGGSFYPWETIDAGAYLGSGTYNDASGFNAASYSEWRSDDSTVIPSQSWWREEHFDLSADVRGFDDVSFRFVIIHGNTPYTQASFGWLLENIQISAANYPLYPPTVEFVSPFVRDTVYSTGPWEINARVQTSTTAPILVPWLVYTVTEPGKQAATDSVLMTHVSGNSLWKASIPQYVAGTEIVYSITGKDSTGNEATARSGYVIVMGNGEECILQDGSTSYGYYPFQHGWGYSRSMALYPASEIEHNVPGHISTVGLRVATASNAGFPVKIWITTVPAAKTTWDAAQDNLDWAVLTQTATLVYDGIFQFTPTGWVDIQLDNMYYYNATDNLVVMFEQNCGGSSCGSYMGTYSQYYYSTTQTNRLWYKYSDSSPPTASSTLYNYAYRPDLRINVFASIDNNSVAMHKIDMPDTVIISPSTILPVVATVKNRGSVNLSSVTGSFSVNGAAPISKIISYNPSLPWDFNHQDTIGYYTPTINGFDTVTVWFSLPNGQADPSTFDDTLSKIIYGTADIYMEFVKIPGDTVYSTGPHEITARITNLSGTSLGTVYLQVTDTSALTGIRNYHTLTMQPQGGNLWSVEIPNIAFDSDVEYLLSLTDYLGNVIELSGSYYIKRFGCSSFGVAPINDYLYTGSIQTINLPTGVYELECWGAKGGSGGSSATPASLPGANGGYSKGTLTITSPTTIYIAVGGRGMDGSNVVGSTAIGGWNGGGDATNVSDGDHGGAGGGATHIAIQTGTLQAIGAANLSQVSIVAGGGGGACYSGTAVGYGGGTTGGTGVLAGGTQTTAGALGGFGYAGHGSGTDGYGGGGGLYGGGSGAGAGAGGGGGSGYIGGVIDALTAQPNEAGFIASPATDGNGYARLTIIAASGDCLDNSVAVDAFISPKTKGDAGTLTPVTVRIRNKGLSDLDSCYINWSLNGITQLASDIVYKNANGLPENFTDTITIGHYPVVMGGIDEIIAWVSMPNGEIDSLTLDDTLKINTLGCVNFAGDYLVGAGGIFPTLNDAINSIKDCGVSGNVNLQLKGIHTGNLNLSNISSDIMQGYTLTISSYDNHPDSAIIRVTSGVGITLSNSNNLTLRAITVDATGGTYGIQFTDACTNVLIRDCKILANPTSTATTTAGVYCSGSSGGTVKLRNVSFINNEISGGYYNFYLYYIFGGTANMGNIATNGIVIDSNIMTDAYYYGIYSYYYNVYKSISYNTITSRSNSVTYYGIYTYYYHNIDKMISNKITITPTSTGYGMYIYYLYNYSGNVNTSTLIANNEIRIFGTSGTLYGLYLYGTASLDVYHNSIYVTGTTGTIYGIYRYTTSTTYLMNVERNISYTSTVGTGYPLYIATATYGAAAYGAINYNNYYSTGANVGYVGAAMATLAALQTATTQDANSVNISPDFVNLNNDLNLVHDVGLMCPRITSVTEDILGVSRVATTSMGCYGIIPLNGNAMLKEITGLTDGIDAGQTENVNVVVYNTGTTPLTDINLGWSVNGSPRGNTNYPVNLQRGDSITITVGTINYPANNVTINVWINNLNNGSLADLRREDDTVSTYINVCTGTYSGLYTIGSGGTFPDIETFYTALDLCGISGDITVALMPGTYEMNLSLADNSTLFGNYKLTITSSTGNANSVILRPSSGVGITMNNTHNIEIRAITIDATNGSYGVQFTGAASNITIRDCRILAHDTVNATGYAAIYKASGTGALEGLTIKNNTLNGGYYNIYLYGSSNYDAKNIVIDSNTMSNSYYYGAYLYYLSLTSTSYNKVTPRSSKEGTIWYGLYFYYTRNGGNIVGNRIYADNSGISSTLYGMRTYYIDSAVVANNEIYLNSSASTTYGMYAYYHKEVSYVYNTILIESKDTASTFRAAQIYISTSSTYSGIYRNNIFIAKSDTSISTPYAIYLSSNPVSYTQYNELDYNNYYSTGDLGYAGGAQADLVAWDTTVVIDTNSVNILPQFVNIGNNLELSSASFANDTLICRPVTGASTDIRGYFRSLIRPSMGAYERPPTSLDLMAWEAYLTEYEAVNNQSISVSVDVLNTGGVTLTNATYGWSVNGQTISTNVSRNFSPSLAMYERSNNISIGTFQASGNIGDIIEVAVWVQTVNGITDTMNWNDTVFITYKIIPLAELVDVLDTVGSLSFDVYATIYGKTGAPVNAPRLFIETIMDNGSCYIHDYDTIAMILQDGIWIGAIPKQYYGSKVKYTLNVSDNVGNKVVLMDSTYIEFGGGSGKSVNYLYTGSVQPVTLRAGTYQVEVWGGNGGNGLNATYSGGNGGKGGYSKGILTVSTPTTLYLVVGEKGENSSAGAGNGLGGDGGFGAGGGGGTGWMNGNVSGGGGGGGLSGIFQNTISLANSVVIAGGGGGGGGSASSTSANHGEGSMGGNGGGLTGQDGSSTLTGSGVPLTIGTPKTATAVGYGGTQSIGGASGGSGSTAGGVFFGGGGYGPQLGLAGDGTTLAGGAGAKTVNTSSSAGGSGGGGGGYYGGGGAGQYGIGGGGGSGYIGNITDGFMAQFGELDFMTNPDTSGNGLIKITSFVSDVYDISHNLAIYELLSPVSDNSTCSQDYLPVQISLSNLGLNDYDFTVDNVTISYEITDPRGTVYEGVTNIDTGEVLSGESIEVELMSSLSILGGTYSIKVWVTSMIDNFICDDTLKASYTSSKLALPIRENFSTGIPMEFVTNPSNGTDVWEWYGGSAMIQPDSGTGMVRFSGGMGSAALLSTRQLDLYQASNPFVEFWYYHDANASNDDFSYMDVNININDNTTIHTLDKIYLRDPNGNHGWTHYKYFLNNYTTGNDCILIQFEAMNKYPGTAQYIDYIQITSEADAAVSEIILTPVPELCSQSGSDISVVIAATRAQSISFGNTDSLILDINGTKHPVSLRGEVLRGNSSDTIPVLPNFAVPIGATSMKVYFSSPVDNMPANDTAKHTIDIRPGFDIRILTISTQQDRVAAELKHSQIIAVENTGNVDLPNIGLILTVTANDVGYHFTTKETVGRSLAPKEIDTIEFDAYTVPWSDDYQIVVHGYLICDSAMLNKSFSEQEYVDMNDLIMVDIIKPADDGTIDTVGREMEVEVKIKNRNQTIYNPGEVKVGILITDIDGTPQTGNPTPEEYPYVINGEEEVSHTFGAKYTVPPLEEYYLVVYIEQKGQYTQNDTLKMRRRTDDDVSILTVNKVSFTMEQNIPNPAKDNTIINYSIPQDGEIVFSVYSVSGQLLYRQKENVSLGNHWIELNISNYASGIYFYTMEYKGQRISKRMSITR
jgi:hypothetical protein